MQFILKSTTNLLRKLKTPSDPKGGSPSFVLQNCSVLYPSSGYTAASLQYFQKGTETNYQHQYWDEGGQYQKTLYMMFFNSI